MPPKQTTNRAPSKAAAAKKPATAKKASSPVVNRIEELSPSNPIPFEGGRGFSLVANAEYLPFLAPDDSYATLLLQARLLSATHNACVITKKDYCAGNGFQQVDDAELTDAPFKEWLKSMNLKDEDIIEINKQIFEYFFTFGNVPIELVRFKVGNEKRFYVYVHNFLEWRLGKPDEDTGISNFAVQSKLFLREGHVLTPSDMENARKLPVYNPRNTDRQNWKKDGKGAERTLVWYKNSTAGFPNYGVPSAVSALIYEILEYKGARFNLDNLDNNMVVSAILSLRGNLTEKEVNKIGRKVLNSHTGDGKRGRVMVVGSEEGIEGSDLHNFNTQKEGSFKESDETWSQKIILANQWDAILAGIVSPSTMGKGAGFLTKVIEDKKKTVIEPAQRDLMRKVWLNIIKAASEWMGFGIDADNLEIKNSIDISGLTDVDITPAVTVDEVRQAKGLPKADPKIGKKYLGELGADQKRGVYVKDNGKKTDPDVQQE